MLYHHRGNRLEDLADVLIGIEDGRAGDPLRPTSVVVPNPGVGRWLALRWARRLGVCANVRFELPARFVWNVLRSAVPDLPHSRAFDPGVLLWRILPLLDELAARADGADLRQWLEQADPRGRYELSRRLAGVLDQYLVYRPDWIREWSASAGNGSHWQAALWRRLCDGGSEGSPGRQREGQRESHWVAAQGAFREALEAGTAHIPGDDPVHVCGLSTLSPAYLDVLAGLSRHRDVHVYLLHPCRQFWLDIEPTWRDPEPVAHAETGNALLASMGQQGRDLIVQLLEHDAAEHDHFREPDAGTALARLQADVLDLVDRGGAEPPLPWPGDDSIQVHVCHGPMREIEVLHDRLLDMFAADPDLGPADVIVMTPDVESWAPHIEAVFDGVPPQRRIPFTVTDRGPRADSPLVDGLFALLELDPRMTAEDLLALLDTEAIGRRFQLQPEEVPMLREWVRESGIRWGVDAAHRGRAGLPPIGDNSWRWGLSRLLLGYATGGDASGTTVLGIAPCGDLEGESATRAGRLVAFAEAVFALHDRLDVPRDPVGWCAEISAVLDRFFQADEAEETQLARLRRAVAGLADDAREAGCAELLTREAFLAALADAVAEGGGGVPFLAGDVTFCGMVPMRSIPFRVVCLVGMNDGAFPRSQRRPGFDLMRGDPRLGDRSRRNDDRYLFLESLLAARERVYISYTGRTLRENAAQPPSVLVSELLDYLDRGWFTEDGTPVRNRITIEHPLHAFSPRGFGEDPRWFSYATEIADALNRARGLESASEEAPPRRGGLFVAPLPEPPEMATGTAKGVAPGAMSGVGPGSSAGVPIEVALDDLAAFLRHPARFLLQRRLGIVLGREVEPVPDEEPMSPDALARYRLRAAMLEGIRAGRGAATADWLRAAGELPHGVFGELWMETLDGATRRMIAALGDPGERVDALEVSLALDGFRLTGHLHSLYREGLVRLEYGRLNGVRRLVAWLQHLVLNAAPPRDLTPDSRVVCEDRQIRFPALADTEEACGHLAGLLALYREGLRQPVPLFPKSGHAYANALTSTRADPWTAARGCWRGSGQGPGEGDDPEYRILYGDTDPLDEAFAALSTRVFEPLVACAVESPL